MGADFGKLILWGLFPVRQQESSIVTVLTHRRLNELNNKENTTVEQEPERIQDNEQWYAIVVDLGSVLY